MAPKVCIHEDSERAGITTKIIMPRDAHCLQGAIFGFIAIHCLTHPASSH
jgi:hypothetical protein